MIKHDTASMFYPERELTSFQKSVFFSLQYSSRIIFSSYVLYISYSLHWDLINLGADDDDPDPFEGMLIDF